MVQFRADRAPFQLTAMTPAIRTAGRRTSTSALSLGLTPGLDDSPSLSDSFAAPGRQHGSGRRAHQRRNDQVAAGQDDGKSMPGNLRTAALLLLRALRRAVPGSAASADDDEARRSEHVAPERRTPHGTLPFDPRYVSEMKPYKKSSGGPITLAEMEAAIEESKRAAGFSHYYPDDPDDPRMDPPPLDDEGYEVRP